MVGCDAPYWTSFWGLTWCLSSFTQRHLLILSKTQAFPQLSIGTAHGSCSFCDGFCCSFCDGFVCKWPTLQDFPEEKKNASISTNQQWCLGSAGTGKKNHRRGGFPRSKTPHPDSSNGISNDHILRIQNVKARTLQSKSAPQKKCWSYNDFSMVLAMPFTCFLYIYIYIRRLCHDICVFLRALNPSSFQVV